MEAEVKPLEYLLSFLEGIITFVSPCLLPMLPIYVFYFTGQDTEKGKYTAIKNATGFVIGFTILFVALGALAGRLGGFLQDYATVVNIVAGSIIIIFGLNFMEVIRLPLFSGTPRMGKFKVGSGFFSSIVFGLVFSVSWTPCVGTFLGSALMLAAQSGEVLKGVLMLLCFSIGLGIPFIASAVLIDRLKSAFDFIKKHYKTINMISGVLLVILGVVVATGLIGYLYALL